MKKRRCANFVQTKFAEAGPLSRLWLVHFSQLYKKTMRNKIHFNNFDILKKTQERMKCEWRGWEEMKNGFSVERCLDHTQVTWSYFLFGLYEKGFGVGPFLNTCELEQHVLYMRTPTSHVFAATPIIYSLYTPF